MRPKPQNSDGTRHPRIGVGVIVLRDGRVLLGRRRNTHGADCWSFPGGHLHFGESPEECARREAREETGLELEELRLGPYTNDIFKSENRHYVTLFVLARSAFGEPVNREPEKCAGWEWFDPKDLPQPLFLPIRNLLRLNGGRLPVG